MRAVAAAASLPILPSLPLMTIAGFRSLAAALVHAPVGDHALGDAGRFVGVSDIDGPSTRSSKPTTPSISVTGSGGIGIPLGEALAALDLVALVHLQARAVLHLVHRFAIGAVRASDDRRWRRCAPCTMRSPSEFVRARWRLRIFTTPSKFDSMKDCSRSAPRRRCGTCAW